MEAISSSFDHFDFVVDSFQPSCMNRIVALIEDSIPVLQQGLGKLFDSCMVNNLRHRNTSSMTFSAYVRDQ